MTPDDLGMHDPDTVGSSEYRAIYTCIEDALEDTEDGEHRLAAISIVREFEEWAHTLRRQLEGAM
jgi:hypothetical protein